MMDVISHFTRYHPAMPIKALTSFYFLGAIFAALASYRMHIEGLEADVFPIFDAIKNYVGRAPDQYRILPYMLIGGLQDLFNLITGNNISAKYPIIIFDATFLFGSILLLDRLFQAVNIRTVNFFLIIIYPYLMFDGYRPIDSFILFLATLCMGVMLGKIMAWRKPLFLLLLTVLAFTRADVALLYALISLAYMTWRLWEVPLVLSVPLAIQLLLSQVLFPDAEYFSQVVMLADNFSGRFLVASPLTYLLLAVLILNFAFIRSFLLSVWRTHRLVLLSVTAYGLLLFVIARPNEFRLFLPMLPVLLALIKSSQVQKPV